MLVVAGVRLRLLLLAAAAGAGAAAALVLSSRNRMERVGTWFTGECADIYSTCWQSTHGTWALASGGWWGVGLGASREKWSWLPEAHNDFIYAIIGEELGLPGTLVVLALLAVIAVAGLRVVLRHDDLFVKIATSGVLAWVVGQGMVNIAVVLGLLPVIGVPLPLVSAGRLGPDHDPGRPRPGAVVRAAGARCRRRPRGPRRRGPAVAGGRRLPRVGRAGSDARSRR